MYELRIVTSARKDFKKLPHKLKNACIESLEDIQEDPGIGKPLGRELVVRL